MDVHEAAELGHRNLIDYSRTLTGWGSRGSFHQDADMLLYASGSWLPVGGNGAFALHAGSSPSRLIEAADEFFGRLGRGYSIKVRDDGRDEDLRAACEAAGLSAFGQASPQMVCFDPVADPEPPLGADVSVRRVDDARGLADFVAVNREAYATYGMPADVLPAIFDRPEVVLADDRTFLVVVAVDGRPMAAALTYVDHGVGGVQWVGTVPEARHRRLGHAVTQWTTNVALAHGAAASTLQASPMGESLYLKLGYTTAYRYVEYIRWRTSGAGSGVAPTLKE
ncbi:MAG TPA: GNAT family N-acetyltransferase [Acidimicrobiales bacterium]|nr:GNAT family N-acetyltransferase [Acidimicrobiales bacterium]